MQVLEHWNEFLNYEKCLICFIFFLQVVSSLEETFGLNTQEGEEETAIEPQQEEVTVPVRTRN